MLKLPGQLHTIKYSDGPTTNTKKALVINPKARSNKKSIIHAKKGHASNAQDSKDPFDDILYSYSRVKEAAEESDHINEHNESENIDFTAPSKET